MSYKGNYVPRSRRKLNYKTVVPFLLIVALGITALYLTTRKNEEDVVTGFTLCNLTPQQSYDLVAEQAYSDVLTIHDYAQYGESLGLYRETYQLGQRDYLDGKTIFLKNLCTGTESVYMMNVSLDEKLPIQDLEKGFYIMEVLDGLNRYRLVSDTVMDETFSTISRNGYTQTARLLANSALFDTDHFPQLDHNFVFLDVDSKPTPDDQVDIVLDPYGMYYEWDGSPNPGATYQGLVEADEMYDAAESIKAQLEAYGLKVAIIRGEDEVMNVHGVDGRLQRAYNYEAKYYIQLRFMVSGFETDKGTTLIYSSYASNRLSTYIMKQLVSDTTLVPSTFTSASNIEGVYRSSRIESMYDYNALLRESGGLLTGAGRYNETYQELNAFAKDIRRGMNTVVLEYGYMSDAAAYQTWINEKEAIINATAEGILKSLGMK